MQLDTASNIYQKYIHSSEGFKHLKVPANSLGRQNRTSIVSAEVKNCFKILEIKMKINLC